MDPLPESSFLRDCCNKHCTVNPAANEEYFTREELIKIRQKKPVMKGGYKMEKLKISKYQKALKDIADINTIIDVL